jgi:hypothetical protein
MMLAADAFDDDAAIRELRELAAGGEEALERYDLKLWIGSLRESATYPPA